MTEVHIDLKSPSVLRTLTDVPTMQRWEILRRAQRPFTVAELAERARTSPDEAQRSLDILAEAGLVVMKPAATRRPKITYQAAMKRLFVQWDRRDPEGVAASRALGDCMWRYSRRVIDAAAAHPGAEEFETLSISGQMSVLLLKDDVQRVRESFLATYAMLAEADRRARQCSEPKEPIAFHVAFDLRRLWNRELPLAEFFVNESQLHEGEQARYSTGPADLLSPRELEIAKLLESGKTRPAIAKELGLTTNTVASLSKIIYRKLGVQSRAALAARMRMG
jgi:DNA-binding CsgD family transcriptional regulator